MQGELLYSPIHVLGNVHLVSAGNPPRRLRFLQLPAGFAKPSDDGSIQLKLEDFTILHIFGIKRTPPCLRPRTEVDAVIENKRIVELPLPLFAVNEVFLEFPGRREAGR